MGLREETIVREFCNAWGDGERGPDIDRIVSMFAEDACWQLYVPGGPVIRGRAALRAEIDRQMGYVRGTQCGITHIVSSGSLVMTERLDHFIKNGHRAAHALMAVFELDEQGLITAWREYFDTWDLARQTGSEPGRLAGIEG